MKVKNRRKNTHEEKLKSKQKKEERMKKSEDRLNEKESGKE